MIYSYVRAVGTSSWLAYKKLSICLGKLPLKPSHSECAPYEKEEASGTGCYCWKVVRKQSSCFEMFSLKSMSST